MIHRVLHLILTMPALLVALLAGTAMAVPPTVTLTTPTTSNLGANQVTLNLTSSATGTGYFTLLTGTSTACGTGAQVKAGQTSGGVTAPYHGSLPLTAAATGQYTGRNLPQSTAYTACFTAEDATLIPVTPVRVNLTTTAAATFTTPTWSYVGSAGFSAGAVAYTSLAYAPDGTPYVAYQESDSPTKKAVVKKYDGSSWVTVGSNDVSTGQADYISLAFAPGGTPYVAYSDKDNSSKATVMKLSGGSWGTVGSAGFSAGAAGNTSLAFAPDGTPYVAYPDGSNTSKATVMKFSGGAWNAVGTAGFSSFYSSYTTVAFAPDGTPYVAYTDSGTTPANRITVKKYSGSSWSSVGGGDGVFSAGQGLETQMAISPDGTLYVAYSDYSGSQGGKLTVYSYTAGGSATLLGSQGFTPGGTSFIKLAVAPDGAPYVAFEDFANGFRGAVMKYVAPSWSSVGSSGFVNSYGQYISLAFAPNGAAAVSFADNVNGNGSKVSVKWLTTTTTLISNKNNQPSGTSLTFTATVDPSVASGTVTFKDGSSDLGTGTLGSGQATYTTSALAIGAHSISAVYGGDIIYGGSTSALLTQTVIKSTLTTTVASNNNPAVYGQSITFTGNAGSASATGTIAFKDGTNTLATQALTLGSATYSTSAFTPGDHSITTVYSGDSNYNSSTSAPLTQTVNKATPTVTVTPGSYSYNGTPQGPGAGQTTTGGSTGTLTFSYVGVSGTSYGPITTMPTNAGSYTVTASVVMDSNYVAASSIATAFAIGKADQAAVTVTAPSSITYGTTGTAAASGGSGSGTYSFLSTGSTGCSVAGSAVSVTNASGSCILTATKGSDNNYNASSASTPYPVTLNKAAATVSLSNLTQNYSSGALTPTATTTPAGLTVDWSNAPQSNAGSYPVTATINSSNYQGSASGQFVIAKVTPTLSITTTQQSYDGSPHGATVTGSVAGSVTTIKYNGIATVPYSAATYAITADFTPTDGNYNSLIGASAGNFTIAKAVPTLAVTNSPVSYTGTAKAATVSGNVSGAVSNVKYDGSATQPINAGNYTVTASFTPADSTNYSTLTSVSAGGFVITKVTPLLSVTTTAVEYDGLPHAATVTASVPGSVSNVLTGGVANQSAVGVYAVTANFIPTDSSNYNSLTATPAGNFAIIAVSKVSVTIRSVPAGLSVTVDGGASQTTPYIFTAIPGSSHTIATTSPQGTVGTRYLFSAWSDGKGISHAITAPNSGSATYTATFTTEYQLTTAVSPAGSGTVIPSSNGWYAAGSTPTIIATAGSGSGFSSWSGPAVNASSSATYVTMNGPISVTAIMKGLTTTLTAAIGAPTGPTGGIRSWPVILTNSGGASAAAVQLTGMTISSSGTCKPVVTSSFPLSLGDIAAGATATGNILVDFSSCAAAKQKTIKFNVSVGYSANNGATTGSTSLTGVPQ